MGARREQDAAVMAVTLKAMTLKAMTPKAMTPKAMTPKAMTLNTGPAAVPENGELADAAAIRESLDQPERFAVLYDRYAAALHRYAGRRVGDDVADDLVAATFLAAFRGRGRYDQARASARPWLFGILTK